MAGQAQGLQPIQDQKGRERAGCRVETAGRGASGGVCPGSRRGLRLPAGGRGLRINPKAIHCIGRLGHRKPVLCNSKTVMRTGSPSQGRFREIPPLLK